MKMNNAVSTSKVNLFRWTIVTAVVIGAMVLFPDPEPGQSGSEETPIATEFPSTDEFLSYAEAVAAVMVLYHEATAKDAEALEEYFLTVERILQERFSSVEPEIQAVVNQLVSLRRTGQLAGRMGYDMFYGTATTEEYLNEILDGRLVEPMRKAVRELELALQHLITELEVNQTEFSVSAGVICERLAAVDQIAWENALAHIGSIKEIARHQDKTATIAAVGVGLEGLFIRSSYRACRQTLGHLALQTGNQLAKRLGTGAAVAAVDGPLPIGTAVGCVIAVGGAAWTGYELYQGFRALPRNVRQEIRQFVYDQEELLRREARSAGEKVFTSAIQNRATALQPILSWLNPGGAHDHFVESESGKTKT